MPDETPTPAPQCAKQDCAEPIANMIELLVATPQLSWASEGQMRALSVPLAYSCADVTHLAGVMYATRHLGAARTVIVVKQGRLPETIFTPDFTTGKSEASDT